MERIKISSYIYVIGRHKDLKENTIKKHLKNNIWEDIKKFRKRWKDQYKDYEHTSEDLLDILVSYICNEDILIGDYYIVSLSGSYEDEEGGGMIHSFDIPELDGLIIERSNFC